MELPAPGQIFQRKYKLQEILGRGGFAAVYRATDVEIGRDVAIKVLAPGDDGYSTGIASRFMREARVIGGFQDPHTITMFEFGRSDDGLLFMVFEYVRGKDLSATIRSRGALPQQDVVHILKQVLQSLREAHAAGVLHRDIKPANILVYDYMGDANRVKLLDFGIAKAVAGDQDGVNLTREGAMIGTPRYMSPEQIYGGELSPRSDLYSLGLVAHEMLVGRPAIVGTTSKEMLRAQLADDPVRLPRGKVLATEAFCTIVDRLTARDPNQRFETSSEVLQALEWVEKNDPDNVPLARSGPIASMDVAPITPSYVTPSDSWNPDRSGPRSSERSYERSGPLTGRSGPQPSPYSGPQRPPPQSGAHASPYSGPQPTPSGPQPTPSGTNSGALHRPPTQDESVPPSTERPLTLDEEDEGDISMGTILGAGLGAAALVVGLLMLMSFLNSRDQLPPQPPIDVQPVDPVEPPAPDPNAVSPPPAVESDAGTAAIDTEHDAGAAVALSGCDSDKVPWRGERLLSLKMTGGATREWVAYLPINYEPAHKYPVVLMFHKTLSDGRAIIRETDFDKMADKKGFVIVAPNVDNPTAPWPGDDGPFVQRALARTAELACLDLTHVYAMGHGQGSVMARDLPCDMPLSAVALTGDGVRVGEKVCTPKSPVPVIRLAGKNDRYTPFEGGSGCLGGEFLSTEETDALWRQRNQCKDKRSQYLKKGADICYQWSCKQPFVSCQMEGGHDWPSAKPSQLEIPGCVASPPEFPVGDTIWKFFTEKGRSLEVAE